jgi:EmrB/QacA subfamily drug resistance transporter
VQRKWLILTAVSLGALMSTLDGSIVNIALPAMQQDFGVDITTVQWVTVAYLLMIGSLLLPMGRLGEVLTFKRVYLAGFGLFTAASVLCAFAPGVGMLIAFRVLQAVGAAAITAIGPAIIVRTFPGPERGRALGLNGVAVSLGLTLGPILGGLLTDLASWRAIFLINLPIGVLAILWARRILPDETPGRTATFDVRGATLSGLSLFTLLLALSEGQDVGWSSPLILALLALAVILAIAFIVVERRAAQPLIDLALFRIRPFTFGLASVIVAFAGLFTATFLLPFLLQQGAGYTPVQAGLMLAPVPIAMAIVAPFAGAAADRWGPAIPASSGMVLMVLALLSLTTLPPGFAPQDLLWRLLLLGVGQGLFMSPNSAAVLGSVPGSRIGTASGVLAQMRVNGQALGIAMSAAVVAIRLPVNLAAGGSTGAGAEAAATAALVASIHDAFIVAAAICAIGIVTSLVRGGGTRGQGHARDRGHARDAVPAR